MPETQPVPLKPEVVVVPYPKTPAPEKEDSDCQIVDDPTAIKKEETGAAQKEDSPAPQAGADPGASEAEPDSGNGSLYEQ